ncbi:amidohydrolase family protein [Endozoicomonas numazuensis]|uniref:adenosine deaminase n=1 Tax=Endozoicomonas numazuensis TaxID=1137799 RepID=A0A081NDI6_9GAMM|nr:hypothetical protein [Endozoicomonas numazuensis]KEQ16509.1 hypothetical protein GZ78_21910 [Endozoicomonas numazuensis]
MKTQNSIYTVLFYTYSPSNMHSHLVLRTVLLLLILISNSSFSASLNKSFWLGEGFQQTSDSFDQIRNHRPVLQAFMNQLPKGGNLHHHLMGAIPPMEIIDVAIERGFCIDTQYHFAKCDGSLQTVKDFISQEENREALIQKLRVPESTDTTQVRNWRFFNFFPLVATLFDGIDSDFVSFIREKAAVDRLSYIESIIYWNEATGPDQLFELITHFPIPDPDSTSSLEDFRAKLVAQQSFQTQLQSAASQVANALKTSEDNLKCTDSPSLPACAVTVRFLHEIHRTDTLPRVYAQMIFAFELAQRSLSGSDPQVLGINIVGPENNDTALNDYLSHMKMLSFLKNNSNYPLVKDHISLHAGELVKATVEDIYYRTTLANAIQIVQPKRIGHGLSLMAQECLQQSSAGNEEYVNCSAELLKAMLDNDIAIEIPFTSNQRLNGIGPKKEHPFPVYAGNNIAVTLATDDPGILKVDLTSQFVEAVYGFSPNQTTNSILLSFDKVIEFTRNSLEFSFLPGQSLWVKGGTNPRYQQRVSACLDLESEACNNFVSSNTKARFQRDHELKLAGFIGREGIQNEFLLQHLSQQL